jgi:flagellar basal-body rod protein FlgC
MINVMMGVQSTMSALDAERTRLDVIGQNIANVNTTHGVDGKPYQRQQVVFETLLRNAGASAVTVAKVEKDSKAPKLVYSPGHPDANSEGMVATPDINMPEEMVDMIAASRAYEANLSVMKNARSMAVQTLAIGKRS